MPITTPRIVLFPKSNSIAFYPAIPSGINVLGQASYEQTIQSWQPFLIYRQKVTFDQQITIMSHVQLRGTATLYICDHYKNTIATVNLNTAPYYKGKQNVTNNNYINPYIGGSTPLVSFLWSFNFNNFISQIPNGGVFYLRMDNAVSGEDTVSCYSEPIFLNDAWANTLLFNYSYNTNVASKNIVNSGWFNDYPTNTIPFVPYFNLRCEGYINMFSPKGINIGYLQQNYMQQQIKTLQARTWTLKIGEISMGIPYYMLEMATEAMLADNRYINNYGYILYNPQGQPSLNDVWKIKDSDVSPLIYANTAIMETNPAQAAILSPYGNPGVPRIFSSEFSPEFD